MQKDLDKGQSVDGDNGVKDADDKGVSQAAPAKWSNLGCKWGEIIVDDKNLDGEPSTTYEVANQLD